jgi:hypothetical protein
MAAALELGAQHVEGEHDAAAIGGLVEKPALLIGGDLSESVLDQLLVGAWVVILGAAVLLFDAGGPDNRLERRSLVVKVDLQQREGTVCLARLVHRAPRHRKARDAVPKIDGVGKPVVLDRPVAEKGPE